MRVDEAPRAERQQRRQLDAGLHTAAVVEVGLGQVRRPRSRDQPQPGDGLLRVTSKRLDVRVELLIRRHVRLTRHAALHPADEQLDGALPSSGKRWKKPGSRMTGSA